MAYKMTKEYDPKRDGPKMPSGMAGKPMKPGMKPGMKPMKPGISNLPSGMVNKPAMNKSPMQEAIRRMRGNK
jgi:hypothetical protein